MGRLETNGGAPRRAEQARQAAHGAIDGMTDRVKPAVDRVARRAHTLVDKAAFAASDAAEAVVSGTRAITDAPSRALERCRTRVRDNPLAFVAAAAVIGAVLLASWQLLQLRKQDQDLDY